MAGRQLRRICLLGASLDVGNKGVLALGASLIHLVAGLWPGAEIAFHYPHRSGGARSIDFEGKRVTVAVLNCRSSPRSRPSEHIALILALALLYRAGIHAPATRNPWLRSLLDADFIGDIRGGDSFSDLYGLGKFLMGSLPLISVAVLGRPYVLLPQTYGPFRSRLSRAIARRLLRGASRVLTRDRRCERTVFDLCGRTPEFCPDVAFTLPSSRPPNLPSHLAAILDARERPIVALNVSGLLYMGGYTGRNMFGLRAEYRDLVDDLVKTILAWTPATIVLAPHAAASEREDEACDWILRRSEPAFPGRVLRAPDPLNEREVKWLIGRSDFFIGSRMHACIAALSQGVPAVGLAYSDKFAGVFESAGIPDLVIDLRTTDSRDVISAALSAFGERTWLQQRLASRIPAVQEQVAATWCDLLGCAPGVLSATG